MKIDLEQEIEEDNRKLEIEKIETKNKIDVTERAIIFYKMIAWILVWAGVAVLVLGVIPFVQVTDTTKSIFNLYGDFVGGVVSSLWSLAGLLFIYLAFLGQKQQLYIQQLDLKHSQIEIKATRLELSGQKEQMQQQNLTLSFQRFENTFFQLLQLQNEIIKSIHLKGHVGINGRDCFEFFYKTLSTKYTSKATEAQNNGRLASLPELQDVYLEVYDTNQADLGHYFRNLYNIYRFINDSKIDDKYRYGRFVRAQLSSHELIFLFYNCLTINGNERFKPLIEEYRVLKNMNRELLLDMHHIYYYEPEAFGLFVNEIHSRIKLNFIEEGLKFNSYELHFEKLVINIYESGKLIEGVEVQTGNYNAAFVKAIKVCIGNILFNAPNWIKGIDVNKIINGITERIQRFSIIHNQNLFEIPVTRIASWNEIDNFYGKIGVRNDPHYMINPNKSIVMS